MGQTSTFRVNVSGQHDSDETNVLSGEPTRAIAIPEMKQEYGDGTGTDQCNAFYEKVWTAAAAADSHDLTGGLTDAFGTALTFTKIRELIIRNRSTTTGQNLTVAGNFITTAVLGGTTPTITVPPGGMLRIGSPVDGFTVTATTADVLSVDPGANTISYDLIIAGTV